MLPPLEYILLKDVPGFTTDHLLTAIMEGHLHAYVEYPAASRYVNMNYKGKLSRYSRMMPPISKDGEGGVIFPKIAILAEDESVVSEYSACFASPIDEMRVSVSELGIKKIMGPTTETDKELCERLKLEGWDDKKIALKLKQSFPKIYPSKIGRLITEVPGITVETDAYRKRGARLLK